MSQRIHDAVIVGGGPAGCAAALALADAGADVVVLEAHGSQQRAPDSRALALSWNSRIILERLGAWTGIRPATPINTIHVSHQGHFGRAELTCADVSLPALGYVARFSDVHGALLERARARRLDYRAGFKVSGMRRNDGINEVEAATADGNRTTRSRLVVVADGGAALARATTTKVKQHVYSQHAVVGLVRPDHPHQSRAFERFGPSGPIALLPCEEEYAFVWTCKPEEAPVLVSLSAEAFLNRLQEAFGDRAGRFTHVRLRSSFPLVLRVAQEREHAGIVLLGNASQTLHPIAGQGFNLGLRDAWDLADTYRSVAGADVGGAVMTSEFRRQRRADRFGAIAFTDGLTRLFSNEIGPLAIARGAGLAMLDALPPLKRALMHQMIFGVGR